MFNEKIFVFFFFWLCLLFATSVGSIFLWLHRIRVRNQFYKGLLDIYVSATACRRRLQKNCQF